MREGLSQLAHLADGEKTEEAMLRSRIDEQSHLIMILKARADEAVAKAKRLENIQDQLIMKTDQLLRLQKEHRLLDKRFHELADNHEELIKFKDDYKAHNKILLTENEQLRKENDSLFSTKVQEKESMIEQLQGQLLDMRQKRDASVLNSSSIKEQLSYQTSNFSERLKLLREQHHSEIHSTHKEHLEKVKKLSENLKSTGDKLKSTQQQLAEVTNHKASLEASQNMKIAKLEAERKEFLEMSVHRGKLLQEKQIEISKSEKEILQLKKSLLLEQDKFRQQLALVSVNSRVSSLSKQLDDTEKEREALKKEFEAYKAHMSNLLENERNLNSKLRHFKSTI